MNYKTIKQFENLGIKNGLKGLNLKVYSEFMFLRFGIKNYYTVESYALEWLNRFKDNNVLRFMDSESENIYKEILKKVVA